MIIYKMLKHEPMNNPALGGEAGLIYVRVCKNTIFILRKRGGSLVLYSILHE